MNTHRTFLPDPAGLWGLIIFVTLSFIGSNKALNDGDTLWHIKMGQVMLERGELLTHDIFSHTAYGKPWHAHEWLSEIIMAVLYNYAGLAGVTIFYFALVALTFSVLLRIASRLAGEGSIHLATVLALPCIYIHLLARPHIFTWCGAALTLYLLERGGRWLWLLIPLTAVWANLHGGVLFGLVLQGIFMVGKCLDQVQTEKSLQLKNWWKASKVTLAVLSLCFFAACLNPFGYQIFLFPFKVAAPAFTQGIGEWHSPDFQELWFARLWLVAVLFMAIWLGKSISWRWHLLNIFIIWQTLGHVRNLSLGALLLIPCFAIFSKELFKSIKLPTRKNSERVDLILSPWSGPFITLALLSAILGTLATNLVGISDRLGDIYVPPKKYLAVMSFLKQGYPDGNLLNEYEWGDYLLFSLDDPPKVFIDGRADMYGEEIFTDYEKITRLGKDTDDLMLKYRISWALFPRDHIVTRYLDKCKNWHAIYQDDDTVILSSDPE